jgi:hypothetical protein
MATLGKKRLPVRLVQPAPIGCGWLCAVESPVATTPALPRETMFLIEPKDLGELLVDRSVRSSRRGSLSKNDP